MGGVAVVGIGNLLMADDGVGIRAVEMLGRSRPLPQAELIDAGASTLDLLPVLLERELVVIVDAVRGGGSPGTSYLIPAERIGECERVERFAHGTGVTDVLDMAEAIGTCAEVVVFGIEPAELRCSLELSEPVAAALPALVERIAEYVKARASERDVDRVGLQAVQGS